MNTTDVLFEVMSLRRPHGGTGVRYVMEQVLTRLPGLEVFNDAKGEAMVYKVTTDPKSTTLFCAHLDTVHSTDGPNPVIYDAEMEWAYKADGQPLGADDAAGIWILYQMIEAGVPGTYLFPVGEERGGIGSGWLAENAPGFLAKFDRAIAFDRKGTTSIITHQRGGMRCCSNNFGDALAKQLNDLTEEQFGTFVRDDSGVFTDTANFMDIIPECTNISAGYRDEHTAKETLDVRYLKVLCAAAIKLDWSALPVTRDPAVEDSLYDDWGSYKGVGGESVTWDMLYGMNEDQIYDLVLMEPEMVAQLLIDMVLEDRDIPAANDLEYAGYAALGRKWENTHVDNDVEFEWNTRFK